MKVVNFKLLYYFFSFIVPMFIVAEKYNIIAERSKYALALGGMLIAYITFRMFKHMYFEMMIKMNDASYMKLAIKQFVRLSPLVLLYIGIILSEIHIMNFKYIIQWSFVSNIIGIIFLIIHIKWVGRDENNIQ